MSEQECKESQIAAIALKGVSLLGVVLLITIPTTFIMVQNHGLNVVQKMIFVLCLLSGFLSGIRSWHLYFDSQLLKNIGDKKMSLSDVDQIVKPLFGKNIQGITIENRIKSCYKLVRGFYTLLCLHLFFFVVMIVFFLLV